MQGGCHRAASVRDGGIEHGIHISLIGLRVILTAIAIFGGIALVVAK